MKASAAGGMGDSIAISGIRAYGYTGFFDAEQSLGQWFEVDLRISVDLTVCGQDDQLAHTLDYSQVVLRVRQLLETSRCRTIERLATLVAEAVLEFPQAERLWIRLTKVAAPIPGFDGRIALELERSRADNA